jgi:hypothetical protein
MMDLEISFHGRDMCTIINKDWSEFDRELIFQFLYDYINMTKELVVKTQRYYEYLPNDVGRIEKFANSLTDVSVDDDYYSLSFTWFSESSLSLDAIVDYCVTLWLNYEGISLLCLSSKGSMMFDAQKRDYKGVYNELLNKYEGYYIWHTGFEENMFAVAKSSQLDFPDWYNTIQRLYEK